MLFLILNLSKQEDGMSKNGIGKITAKSWVDFGLNSELTLDEMIGEIESRRNQDNKGTIVAVSDPRIKHILATLNAKLGISMNLSDLPPVPANPDPNKFPNLVLVLAKTTLDVLVLANRITSYIDLQRVKNADGVKTPKGDYWLWMQGGKLYRGMCVKDATKLFSTNERGGTCKEGLFFYTCYPESLNECFIDFAGSRIGSGSVPYLCRWIDVLGLSAAHPAGAFPRCGSVSAGVSLDS